MKKTFPTLFALTAAAFLALPVPGPVEAAPARFHDAVLASAPIVHYSFDETEGEALNHGSLGPSFDAAVFGSPARAVPGLSGDGGIELLATSQYLESFAVVPDELTGNPTFSAEAVLHVPVSGSVVLWGPILHWGPSLPGDETGTSVYFAFAADQTDEAFVGFYNGGLRSPDGSMPPGRWHHLLWVRSGGGNASQGSTLYLDGVDVTASLVGDPLLPANTLTPTVSPTELRINRGRDFEGTRVFQGTLDEVALYDRALSAVEAAEHYRALTELFSDGFEEGDSSAWD